MYAENPLLLKKFAHLIADGNDGLLAKSMEELLGIIGELCGVVFLE